MARFSELRPAPSLRDERSRASLLALLVPAIIAHDRASSGGQTDALPRMAGLSRPFRRFDARAIEALCGEVEARVRRDGDAAALADARATLSPTQSEAAALLAAIVAGGMSDSAADAERAAASVAEELGQSPGAIDGARRVARALTIGLGS